MTDAPVGLITSAASDNLLKDRRLDRQAERQALTQQR